MSVSKQEKGLCAWNEEKHFAVRSWRLMADFTWRTEVVASASFCKFPTVICKFRLHSMYFFFPRLPSESFLEGNSIEWLFVLMQIFLESRQPSEPLTMTWRGVSFRVCCLLPRLEPGFLGPRGIWLSVILLGILSSGSRGWYFCKWSEGSFIHANVCHTLLHRQLPELRPSGCVLNYYT